MPWSGKDDKGKYIGWSPLLDWQVIKRVYPNAEIKIVQAPSGRSRQEFLAGRVDIFAYYDDPILEQHGYKLIKTGSLSVNLWLNHYSPITTLVDALNSNIVSTPVYRFLLHQTFSDLHFLPSPAHFPELVYAQRYDGAVASKMSFIYQARENCIPLSKFKSIELTSRPYYYWLRKGKPHDQFIEHWYQAVLEETPEQWEPANYENRFRQYITTLKPPKCSEILMNSP